MTGQLFTGGCPANLPDSGGAKAFQGMRSGGILLLKNRNLMISYPPVNALGRVHP